MEEIKKILAKIKKGEFAPVYFLMGEEPYFIDLIANTIQNKALTPEERQFNEYIFYGKDISVENLMSYANEYSMWGGRRVIIVKEAQELSRSIAKLIDYVQQPNPNTVLVICYKAKYQQDKKLIAQLKKHIFVESKKLYENQVGKWLLDVVKEKGFKISVQSAQLLVEYLGTDLSRIVNELDKLAISLEKGAEITPQVIQDNIGISKDYNVFELQNAFGMRNGEKAMKIIQFLAENPRETPIPVVTSSLYAFFEKLLAYHGLENKSDANVAKELKIHSFFAKDYHAASRNYPMKKVSKIIESIRKIDVKSKGVEAGTVSYDDLLKELYINIMV